MGVPLLSGPKTFAAGNLSHAKYGMELSDIIAEVERRKMLADPVAFAEAVGFRPDPWQEKLLRSKGKRKILNCSRQVGKSTVTSIAVLHHALFIPQSLILLVSPSERQSVELFRKVMAWLDVWTPGRKPLPEENKTSCEFPNGSRIVSLPSSEGTVRGYSGVAKIIVDEASKVPDDLYRAIRPMLLVNHGELWALSSPFGKRGWFYSEWGDDTTNWERYRIPVFDVPRLMNDPETRAFIEEERRSHGERWFSQEYLTEFVELEDSVFPDDLISGAFSREVEPLFRGDPIPPEVDTGEVLPLNFGDDEIDG